uniref:Uncharacterized protein n=1 Tax=Xenopus tropicalis TaxID=8364 RepID=A0A6I8S8W4_XENTR
MSRNWSYAMSSQSLEQSMPAAVPSNWMILSNFCFVCFSFQGSHSSRIVEAKVNSAAISKSWKQKPSALDALSLIHHSFYDYLISSEMLLSSVLAQNSSQLSRRPESRNFPVDFSSIPAISLNKNTIYLD